MSSDYDAIRENIARLEREHFKTPCATQRCGHLASLCDCFFMLTGEHASDCPAAPEETP